VASSYEVTFHVRTSGSVTSVGDVLTQTLPGAGEISSPTVLQTGDELPVLLVRMTVDADDSSGAGLAGRAALDRAVRDAGLSPDAVTVDAPDIRASA
jgi:hypothetical protein